MSKPLPSRQASPTIKAQVGIDLDTAAQAEIPRSHPAGALSGNAIHARWQERYRTEPNLQFFERALSDAFAPLTERAGELCVLDAGCGSGSKSKLMAQMGFDVIGVDMSEDALAVAREHAKDLPRADKLRYSRQDLTSLELETGAVDAVLCWGVLMHVEDVAAVVRELARVTKPGGMAVVSEGNCHSVQSRVITAIRTLRRSETRPERGSLGRHFWRQTSQGRLLIRHMDIPRLAALFAAHGFLLCDRRAGQFTEAYAITTNGPLAGTIHGLNRFWYANVRRPGPAFGNLLVFVKTAFR